MYGAGGEESESSECIGYTDIEKEAKREDGGEESDIDTGKVKVEREDD